MRANTGALRESRRIAVIVAPRSEGMSRWRHQIQCPGRPGSCRIDLGLSLPSCSSTHVCNRWSVCRPATCVEFFAISGTDSAPSLPASLRANLVIPTHGTLWDAWAQCTLLVVEGTDRESVRYQYPIYRRCADREADFPKRCACADFAPG